MRNAIISVSDKSKLDIIANYLVNNKWKIISSGGTFKALKKLYPNYDNIIKVEDITGFPEILGGRVKTLHPKIHGGILASNKNTEHINEINEKNIPKISMVIVNLYPFEKAVLSNADMDNALENIDIGGHSLIRAASKNYKDVLVITNPDDYVDIISILINKSIYSGNAYSCETIESYNKIKLEYAKKAWKHVTKYDMAISHYFNNDTYYRVYNQKHSLKYGCNPHQKKASIGTIDNDKLPFVILNGNSSVGYINILDAINSWRLVCELGHILSIPVAASFKHTSPAGVGVGAFYDVNGKHLNDLNKQVRKAYCIDLEKDYSPVSIAYVRARNSDPMSSFGDFVAIYGKVDVETALLIKREVSDGIIALDYTEEALDILKTKKKGKYIILKGIFDNSFMCTDKKDNIEYREIGGFYVAQQMNYEVTDHSYFDNIVTKNNNLSIVDKTNLMIANISLKYAQSNSVAYAYDGQLVGLGAGQQSRVDCVKLAGRKTDTWFLRQHPKVLYIYSKFISGVKRQDKINACIRYIEGDFTDIEKKYWDKLFIKKIDPLTMDEKQEYLSKIRGVALASDAFFPFRDNIDHCSKRGVSCIIQPGGSIADKKIIEACNEYNITMAFSGIRVFTH